MPRLPNLRLLLLLAALLAALMPPGLIAQDDPNHDADDTPLGDLARTLRKKTPPSHDVIDDDNLTKVMERAESRHSGSALKFLMAGESKGFPVAAPDVTCSLSFTASAKSLLSGQYAQMELPPGEVLKLEGPATIEGDALIVSVHNRTDWHVSEVAVALTVVKKTEERDASLSNPATPSGLTSYGSLKLLPAVAGTSPLESEVRPEKKPDLTVIYRMRAAASPSATTVFSAPLNLDLAADQEWHWAIVEARGYPPRSYAGDPPQMATPESSVPTTSGPRLSPALGEPQNSAAVPLPQSLQ
jgi:hypothetical protein